MGVYFSQKIRKGIKTMYTVTYYKNGERKATTWDTFAKANSYAMYLWDCNGVYNIKIEEVK